MPIRPAGLAAVVTLIGAGLAAAAFAQDADADRGRSFAEANCARCHAIDRTGDSPLPAAVPFRDLHTRYAVEYLEEAFARGIVTGHPLMPEFPPDAGAVRDMVAYLRTLE